MAVFLDCRKIECWPALLAVPLLFLAQLVSAQPSPPDAQPPLRQFYQDFRGGKLLHPALELHGPNADEVSKPEVEGLRITLPDTRTVHYPVEVVTTFAISGDFEITSTYELLSATRPDKGYGVGVGLNIADTKARGKFAKIARAMIARGGSVFLSEYWVHEPRKDYQTRTKQTTSRIGQLRLVRKGADLRCLAADGLEGDFQEIFVKDQFGTEDMAYVHLAVTDSGQPGNAVDARLIDLKIRAAKLIPDPGSDLGSVLPPPAQPPRKAEPKKWLKALAIMVVLLLASLAVFLLVRRHRRSRNSPPAAPVSEEEENKAQAAAPPLSLRCSICEKTLKVKPELVGKKIKCPNCGEKMAVPTL